MALAPLAELDLDDLRPHAPHQHPRHVRRRPAGRPARCATVARSSTSPRRCSACAPQLRRLRRQQGRRRGADPDPRPRAARPRHHRQRRRPRPDRHRPVPRRQGRGDDRQPRRAARRSSASARRRTSPRSSPSWPARPAGSTARSFAPTAASSDGEHQDHRHHRRFQRFRRPHRPGPRRRGHTVYAGMRETDRSQRTRGRGPRRDYAPSTASTCAPSSWTCSSQESVDAAIASIMPSRATSTSSSTTPATWSPVRPRRSPPSRLAALYDVNVLCTQRVNRAVLPAPARTAATVSWCGSSQLDAAAAPRPTSRRTSPPRPPWTRSPSATRPNCAAFGHRDHDRRARCVHLAAPTTSPTRAHPPTRAVEAEYEDALRRPDGAGRRHASPPWPRPDADASLVADEIAGRRRPASRAAAVPRAHRPVRRRRRRSCSDVADRIRREFLTPRRPRRPRVGQAWSRSADTVTNRNPRSFSPSTIGPSACLVDVREAYIGCSRTIEPGLV